MSEGFRTGLAIVLREELESHDSWENLNLLIPEQNSKAIEIQGSKKCINRMLGRLEELANHNTPEEEVSDDDATEE